MAGHLDVDESFAEYVAARWSMLYRLAVLLAGDSGADALTEEALVRAHLAWAEVQEAASADDRVKAILASTYVHLPNSPAEATSTDGEADRLWAEIGMLPPRQRAVLVLRHYEGLTDPEIAHTVGSSTSTVTAEAGALETGIDLADLRALLWQRAEDALVPPPPIDALVARGHQARRRRTGRAARRAGIAAAVLVVGLVVAVLVDGRSSDPTHPGRPAPTAPETPRFLSSLPAGARPTIPYSVRHFLYLEGGRGVDLAERPAAIASTPRWVYIAYLSGKIVRVSTETLLLEPVVDSSGGQLVGDLSGGQVAWLGSGVGKATVDLTSLDRTTESSSDRVQEFPARLRCCDDPFQVNGITEDGQLIASLPAENRAWVWDTHGSGGVREISGLGNGVISQVSDFGLVVHYPPFQYAVGQIQDGAFLQVGEIAALDADFSDPLGHRIVYADNDGAVRVRERDIRGRSRRTAPTITLRLPTLDDGYSGVRWEDENHVILDVYDESAPDGALVRCDVRDGSCELADELEGPHLLAGLAPVSR
jgi:hypothetical protein